MSGANQRDRGYGPSRAAQGARRCVWGVIKVSRYAVLEDIELRVIATSCNELHGKG